MFNTSYGNENNGKGNRNIMYYNEHLEALIITP